MKLHVSSVVLALAISALCIQVAGASQPITQQVAAKETLLIAGDTVGEIKNIDAQRGTVTLKHGPIENLGMPDMTMVFRVLKPIQITSFKVGDTIRFKATRVQGALVLTELITLN